MAGFSVDPAELGRSADAAHLAGQSLSGTGPLTTEADQAAPQLIKPNLVERVLTIADSAGRTFTEGKAVLDALAAGLRFAAENYNAADKTIRTATAVPAAPDKPYY
jgi:hypothetical protein